MAPSDDIEEAIALCTKAKAELPPKANMRLRTLIDMLLIELIKERDAMADR